MTPIQRAKYVAECFRQGIITGKKIALETLIEEQIKEAEETAVERYLAEQDRLQQVKETKRAFLEKAREAKAKRRGRKKGD